MCGQLLGSIKMEDAPLGGPGSDFTNREYCLLVCNRLVGLLAASLPINRGRYDTYVLASTCYDH